MTRRHSARPCATSQRCRRRAADSGGRVWCIKRLESCAATPKARQHGLGTRAILVEVGRRKMVGGQEDMITGIALDLIAAALDLIAADSAG